MRIIGPNSMGLMNGRLNLNGSFASGTADGRIPSGSIACLSQSGATISAMLQWFGKSSVGFSWLVSTGDESATGLEELMEALVNDPAVGTIMLFLEGVKDGARFRRAALAARLAGKPVVMLQVGKSEKGREAVQSHTGRVAGAREVFAAVARETGVIQTESFVEFYGTSKALSMRSPRPGDLPRNRRAAVITVSGGAASLCADQLARCDGNFPHSSGRQSMLSPRRPPRKACTIPPIFRRVGKQCDASPEPSPPLRSTIHRHHLCGDGRGRTVRQGGGAGDAEAASSNHPGCFCLLGRNVRSMCRTCSTTRASRHLSIFRWRRALRRLAPRSPRASGTARRPSSSCGSCSACSRSAANQGTTRAVPSRVDCHGDACRFARGGLPCAPFDVVAGLDTKNRRRAEKIGFPSSSNSARHDSTTNPMKAEWPSVAATGRPEAAVGVIQGVATREGT